MSRPRVSVLVPCWNDASYLDAALESVAAQSHPDFEVVVSDDGSTDDSPAIADAWARRDIRFRFLRSEANRGMAENWNHALRAARGELVTKLDGDDTATPGFLACLVEELADAAVAAAFCRTVECDESLRPIAPWHGERVFSAHGLDAAARTILPGLSWWAMCFDDHQLWHSNAFLVPRHELLALGGWDERWSCAADTDLILRLLEQNRGVVHSPTVGIHYRRRTSSVSARASAEGWKQLEAILVALASLQRAGRPLAGRSRNLRQNWWRLWRAAAAARREEGLAARLPPRQVAKLLPQLDVARPPARVLIEGELRALAWRTRRAIAAAAVGRAS